jgi:AbrB family looped-hinge helix DNA binding protein
MEVSTMTSKGQIVVPARLRKRYGIKPGTKIHFIERNHEILFQPVTKEYIRSLCGILKSDSYLTKELLKERARDKKREEEKLVKRGAR